ncbi:MAG: Rrf2 family transcriptional regulator [Clostridiales bacterium]|nr:Rrf2 family transcriptional regulator [Clostridiales bacterium]
MKLSMKSRYGLRALIDLSIHSKREHGALNSISERNAISPQYLEQVFASLRKAGLVRSVKGPQGGYLLARDAKEITVASIIEALEGEYRLEPEVVPEECRHRGGIMAIQKLLIDRVNRGMEDILNHLTLDDLEKESMEYSDYGENMYYI